MSKENVERHSRGIDAINRRDLDALLALMDDEVEAVSRIVAMEGPLQGHGGIRQWWENWFSVFPDYEIEVVEIRDFGDVTVATLRALTRGAVSAVPLEDKFWQASRWRRGKQIWWRTFYTWEEALKAVGLEEQAVWSGMAEDREGPAAVTRSGGPCNLGRARSTPSPRGRCVRRLLGV